MPGPMSLDPFLDSLCTEASIWLGAVFCTAGLLGKTVPAQIADLLEVERARATSLRAKMASEQLPGFGPRPRARKAAADPTAAWYGARPLLRGEVRV